MCFFCYCKSLPWERIMFARPRTRKKSGLKSRKSYLSSSGRRSQRRMVKILLSRGITLQRKHSDAWHILHTLTVITDLNTWLTGLEKGGDFSSTSYNPNHHFWRKNILILFAFNIVSLIQWIFAQCFSCFEWSLLLLTVWCIVLCLSVCLSVTIVSQSQAVTSVQPLWSFCHRNASARAEAK